jgi:hypothetical protein
MHIEERGVLNASQFGFHARHSTTLQCMRLMDHVTLNFYNNMSTSAVFLDTEDAFAITWYVGSLCQTSKLKFLISLIMLISSLLSQRKFRISVEDGMSTPRDIQAGVSQGSVLSPTFYSIYIIDRPQTPGVYLGLFVDDTCLYATDRKEGLVLRKLQRDLIAIET